MIISFVRAGCLRLEWGLEREDLRGIIPDHSDCN